MMLRNYIKTAWRVIHRNKVYSAINVVGLTIGLCACMMVGSVVMNDLSYDKQWSRGSDMYRIITVNDMGNGIYDKFPSSFAGFLPVLKNDFPEVENAAYISTNGIQLKVDDAVQNGIKVSTLLADTCVWDMLDFKVVDGDPKRYVAGQPNLVITKSFREKHFPDQNPVGKIFHVVPTYQNKATAYLITGIIEDIPSNSVFSADALILNLPMNETLNIEGYGTFLQSYVLLKKGTDSRDFTKKFNDWYADYSKSKTAYRYEFQPVKDIYLHSDFPSNPTVQKDYKNVFILGAVALLLLIISCVNYINLGTARAVYRLKETTMRKILGAGRNQLIGQYLTESLIFFLAAMMLAVLLYGLTIPAVENFLGYDLAVNILRSPLYLSITFAGVLLLSLLVGFYPAWILSGFKPALALKGKIFKGSRFSQNFVRKSLVVLQFGISLFVLIALIVVQYQLSFMKRKDIGFQKDHLLNISYINWQGKGETFRQELKKIPGVEHTAISSWEPGRGAGYMSRQIDHPQKPGEKINVWYINGSAELSQTLGLRLREGRFLNPELKTDAVPPDSAQVNMQNRSALLTSYSSGLLQMEELNRPLSNVSIVPVGVVADFNSESLKSFMKPTIITAEDSLNYGSMLVRVQPGADMRVATAIDKMWRDFFPENLLEIKWVDDMVNQQYKEEEKLSKTFTFFSSLAMLLAAMGIFGLIVQATAQRTKEIGIRKVLGASVDAIVRLFMVDFVKLIIIALGVASPIAWWLMNNWLLDYAYRIRIQWWIFGTAGAVALAVALLAISFQAIKAATANPVESLRDE